MDELYEETLNNLQQLLLDDRTTDEQAAVFDTIIADIDKVSASITREEKLAEAQRNAPGRSLWAVEDGQRRANFGTGSRSHSSRASGPSQ